MLGLSPRDIQLLEKKSAYHRRHWLYYNEKAGKQFLYMLSKLFHGGRKPSGYYPYARHNKLGLFGAETAKMQRCVFKFRMSAGRRLMNHMDYLNREGAGRGNTKPIFFNALSDDLEKHVINYHCPEKKNQILHNSEITQAVASQKDREAAAAGAPRVTTSYYDMFSEAEEDETVFRFMISPDRTTGYDINTLTKDFMKRLESEIGVPLAWMATAHYDTGHPHVHITLRGKDQYGNKLFLNKELLKHGCRVFARRIITNYIGERTGPDILDSYRNEVRTLGFTKLDYLLTQNIDPQTQRFSFGKVHMDNKLSDDLISMMAQRLGFLNSIGFAEKLEVGLWKLDSDLHKKLSDASVKNDINSSIGRMNALYYKSMEIKPMEMDELEKLGGLFGRIVYREVTGYFDNNVMLFIETGDHKVRGVRLTQAHEVMMPGLKTGNFCSITPRSKYNKVDQAIIGALGAAEPRKDGLYEMAFDDKFLATYGLPDVLAVKRRLRHFEEFNVCVVQEDDAGAVTAVFEPNAAETIDGIAAKRRSQYNVMPEGSAERDLVPCEEGLGMNFLDRHLMHNCDLATDFYVLRDADHNYDVMYIPHLSKDESEVTRWEAQLMDSVCRRIEYHMKNNRIFTPPLEENRLRYGRRFSHRLWAESAEFSRLMHENRTNRDLGTTRNPEGGEDFNGLMHVDEELNMVFISEINKEPRSCVVLPLVHNLRKYDNKFISMKYPELFARNRQARDFYIDIKETDRAGVELERD